MQSQQIKMHKKRPSLIQHQVWVPSEFDDEDSITHKQLIDMKNRGSIKKLDQGALGMSDPCGPLQLAL